jgi:biopolymer transport protein ExbD
VLRRDDRLEEADSADVDIAPLIDVVFLLLVFFMSIWQAAHMEVKAELTLPPGPQANPEIKRDQDRLVINVDYQGDYYVSNRLLSLNQLREQVLRPEAARNRDAEGFSTRTVYIRADADIEWQHVREVMQACRKVGIWKLAFRVAVPKEDIQR